MVFKITEKFITSSSLSFNNNRNFYILRIKILATKRTMMISSLPLLDTILMETMPAGQHNIAIPIHTYWAYLFLLFLFFLLWLFCLHFKLFFRWRFLCMNVLGSAFSINKPTNNNKNSRRHSRTDSTDDNLFGLAIFYLLLRHCIIIIIVVVVGIVVVSWVDYSKSERLNCSVAVIDCMIEHGSPAICWGWLGGKVYWSLGFYISILGENRQSESDVISAVDLVLNRHHHVCQ